MLLIALLFIAETSGDLACGQPYFGGLNPSTVSNLKTPKDSTGIVIPTGLTPQNFVYASSQGYDLPVKNLPWGAKPYTVTRYRIDALHNLDQVDQEKGAGGGLHLTAVLPPPSVELIGPSRK